MKSTIKLFFAAFVASMVFSSCTKDMLDEQGKSGIQSEGTRVISVSFGNQTRTALDYDGLTPKFVHGDEILVYNETDSRQKCTVTFDKRGNAIITTKLEGTLTALYPANVTVDRDGKIRIPTTQSGKFANANICMAENITGNEATFHNKTAILRFYVDSRIGVETIDIRANGNTISTITAPTGKTLADVAEDSQHRICYVAVSPEINANELTFASTTSTQGTVVSSSLADVTLEAGKMYNAFIPYYIEVGNVKWGYCNVGAFFPEESGEYFAWGETAGKIEYEGNWFTNERYYSGSVEAANLSGGIDPGSKFDAASVRWGECWRLPSNADILALNSATRERNTSSDLFVNDVLQIPYVKMVNGQYAGFGNHFWSSERADWNEKDGHKAACYMDCSWDEDAPKCKVNSTDRYHGLPIRPVYSASADGTTGELNGHGYVIIAGKKWATQNVAISASGQMKWKGAGSSAVKVPGTDSEEVMIGDYFQWAAYPGYCGNENDADKGLLIYESFSNKSCVDGGTSNNFTFKKNSEEKSYRFSKNDYENYVGIAPYYSSEWTKYQCEGENKDGKMVLEPDDDVAHTLWGETWRTPSPQEFLALCAACYVEWDDVAKGLRFYPAKTIADKGLVYLPNITYESKWGKLSGSSYASTSVTTTQATYNAETDVNIFFPAAGYAEMTNYCDVGGAGGDYSTNTLNVKDCEILRHLDFCATVRPICYKVMSNRYYGLPIRPVSD